MTYSIFYNFNQLFIVNFQKRKKNYMYIVLVSIVCHLKQTLITGYQSLKGVCLIFLSAIYQLFIKYFNIK